MKLNFGLRSWGAGGSRITLTRFMISLILVQFVLCDTNKPERLKSPRYDKIKSNKVVDVKKTDLSPTPTPKSEKPILVVAEKVESPPNWNSWTPVPENSTNWAQVIMTTPPPSEGEEQHKRTKHQQNHKVKEEKRETLEKMTPVSPAKKNKKGNTKTTFELLQSQAMNFGKMLFNSISGESSSLATVGEMARLASAFTNTFSTNKRSENSDFEPVKDANSSGEGRGALDWLSRLIGVQGKTLGEFLREYQVHVLYDLVFIFFKWIFFVYAGLLIP